VLFWDVFNRSQVLPIQECAQQVLVGGEECDVKTVNDTQIECRTPAQPGERLLYPGGRGILHEVFDTQDIDANLDELSAGDVASKCENRITIKICLHYYIWSAFPHVIYYSVQNKSDKVLVI